MTSYLSQRKGALTAKLSTRTKLSGWVLEKQPTSFAEEGEWTNIDSDVTPEERRTWSSMTIAGFWFSDALNAQGWEAPSSIISAGLTWKEAFYLTICGSLVDTVPLVMNGLMGARLHIPFPVAIRSSFGFYFSRFAIVVRMATALFWHAIQTWTGSTATFQIIRSIFPSFLNIPNHLPESAGITTQEMIAHFVFWSVQFPFMLTPPHKLKYFFYFKAIIVPIICTAVVIAMTKKAHGVGEIWKQGYSVPAGSARSWMILNQFSSICGGWATMATNVPDFTRYMKRSRGVWWQALLLPSISLLIGTFGIISTSCAKVVYGEYIWSPLDLASRWHGPWGRCGAFFVGFCWVVAQIGTNLSANVISCSNDMVNLCPKYINIRRGAIITTVTAGWIMVPWKIISSAQSLLTFMSGLSIFLAPIAAMLAADYWIVKSRKIDVPGLYRRHGRYRYNSAGTNWRAAITFAVSLGPNLPGMAKAVNSDIKINAGIEHIWDMNYLWGFSSAFVLYVGLSKAFPAEETLLEGMIWDDSAQEGIEVGSSGDDREGELGSDGKLAGEKVKAF
ncbi:permease for cytosine/purines, uracil, thiamine, allantoin-domain-containing protein [Cadophora sp. MPI-SDFR-AT-0126]|nr:permease for cytosine/purines, uracil, thiamine, allantoin-domain-containing protein [Leotiomycetes sp. MPI-SDFR-AT-0126]